MKNILKYIPVILALFLWSCDPMEDVYDELDSMQKPYHETVEYKLVKDDYKIVQDQALEDAQTKEDSAFAKAVYSDMAFNQRFTAQDYMRYVLHANYIALGKESAALVEYNTTDKPEELMVLEGAHYHRLSAEDYALVEEGLVADGEGFYPGYEAETYMPDILAAAVEAPVEGDLIRVNYKYFIEEPTIGSTPIFTETFNDETLGQFTSVNVAGQDLWAAKSRDADFFAEASGYNAGACEDWLISNEIDLTRSQDVKFQIKQYANYLPQWEDLRVLVSKDYSGNQATATWEELIINDKPAGNNHDWVLSEMVDLSAYEGETIVIAFKYVCTATDAARWRINDVNVFEKGITGDYDTRELMYEFDGSNWMLKHDLIIVSKEEYNAMGAPGKYDNFSASDAPDNYLPTYLMAKYPYAQQDDEVFVGYKYYYNRSTDFRVSKYSYTDGMWSSASSGPFASVSNQFVHNGTTWMFDPTIKFIMVGEDYQHIVDYVKNNISEDYVRSSGDSEYYYGASAYYGNLDLRISRRKDYNVPTGVDGKDWDDLSEEEALKIIWDRVQEAMVHMLEGKYPEAVTEVGGIEVYYEVTFKSYENDLSSKLYTYKLKCTKSAPNPEFEFVEDITPE